MKESTTSSMHPVMMFSGQGSQKPGMGVDLLDIAEVKDTFECASEVFGFSVEKLVREASQETLNETMNAQVALVTLSVGIAQALEIKGITPSAVLGFSLGQISAFPLAGMLGLEQTFELVKVRSELMAQAAVENPGAMCALLGASEQSVQDLCAEQAQGDVLVPANYNSPEQIVIAGTKEAIERAELAWTAQKKRSVRLATAGAFHSPLMQEAAEELDAYLAQVTFSDPCVPLISNVDASPLTKETARTQLVNHLTHPVLFSQSVSALQRNGATNFVEVGFGGVLMGLVKRIDKTLQRDKVEDRKSFEKLMSVG